MLQSLVFLKQRFRTRLTSDSCRHRALFAADACSNSNATFLPRPSPLVIKGDRPHRWMTDVCQAPIYRLPLANTGLCHTFAYCFFTRKLSAATALKSTCLYCLCMKLNHLSTTPFRRLFNKLTCLFRLPLSDVVARLADKQSRQLRSNFRSRHVKVEWENGRLSETDSELQSSVHCALAKIAPECPGVRIYLSTLRQPSAWSALVGCNGRKIGS